MFAHSLKFVLPRTTAPASRSFRATPESCAGREPTSASDPAVVCMRSAVSMLSLISTGIPCIGPRGPFDWRSFQRCRNGESSGIHLNHAVQRRASLVDFIDSFEIRLSQGAAGQFPGLHSRLKVRDRDL